MKTEPKEPSVEQASKERASLGFEALLWSAAGKLRGYMDVCNCKHVVHGLIFLKYISVACNAKRAALPDKILDENNDSQFGFIKSDARRWRHQTSTQTSTPTAYSVASKYFATISRSWQDKLLHELVINVQGRGHFL